jgi:hypothetical protein
MITIRIQAEIKDDHRVVLTLPPEVPTGHAELVVSIASKNGSDPGRERDRAMALDQFLALARSSSFRSAGPYPSRDELHERS